MNKLILNSVSYILVVNNTSDDICPKCALNDLPGGCCSPCEVFDHHGKGTIEGSCYFIEETEETEKAKETMVNKKAEVAKKLYDVLGPLECNDDCPLIEICESPNSICNDLKDIIND
jgi:hypothetical protein